MLASMRAELLVLRKWPAACGLLLVTPALVLLSDYVAQFVSYLKLTPADYATYGTPSQAFGSLTPSQFNIIAVNQFNFSGTAPFIILGAVMAGSDWGRGTITTALLQRPGRAATSVGQALAAALVLALAYATIGLALGIGLRSATAGIGAVLLWAVIVQPSLEYFAAQLHGIMLHLYEILPNAATNTVVNLEGNPNLALYGENFPTAQVAPVLAFLTLGLYAAAFLALPALITRRRDIA